MLLCAVLHFVCLTDANNRPPLQLEVLNGEIRSSEVQVFFGYFSYFWNLIFSRNHATQ